MKYLRKEDRAIARIRLINNCGWAAYKALSRYGEKTFASRSGAEWWLRMLGYLPEHHKTAT